MLVFFVLVLAANARASVEPLAEWPDLGRTLSVRIVDSGLLGPGRQFGEPNSELARPLVVQVVDASSGAPLERVPVRFKRGVSPAGATLQFDSELATTNASGMAQTTVRMGASPGEYLVSAEVDWGRSPREFRSLYSGENDSAFFQLTARKSLWPFFLVIELLSGLALFMYGVSELSVGMRSVAGNKLRRAMEVMTHNRFLAMAVGVFITVLFQSSCATTVMLVGFVQAGLLRAVQSLAIILGADIGTTMTVQLFAFKVTDYTLVAVAIGFFMQTYGKRAPVRAAGQAVLGLGLLFFGMSMMQQSTAPLRSYEPFVAMLTHMKGTVPAILAGAVATALIRSSAVFIGIAIVFASQGLVDLQTGIALCLGANLGTCVTALLASLNTAIEARRVALAHMLFKVLGILILVTWIPTFARLVVVFSGDGSTIERQIANAHTLFNVGIAFSFIPFLKYFNRLIEFILPDERQGEAFSGSFSLERQLLLTPGLALAAARREIVQIGRDSQRMLLEALAPLLRGEVFVDREELMRVERTIDLRYEATRSFLSSLLERDLPREQVSGVLMALRTLHDFEQIADIVEDRVIPRVEILRDNGLMLSEVGRRELAEYHTKVLKQISRGIEVFDHSDVHRARRAYERFERYCLLAYELKDTHFQRLRNHVVESEQTTNVHLNLISALLDISNLATNIARHLTGEGAEEHLSHSSNAQFATVAEPQPSST
jgi:phosphate:Na+ symporter